MAQSGSDDYSRLSVIVQLLSQVDHVMRISKNSFVPAPKVDTCFMSIEPKVPRPQIDMQEFDSLLKVCFGRKNKTLSSNLKTSFLQNKIKRIPEYSQINPDHIIDQILENLEMQETRTSKMDIEDFLLLLLRFKKANIHFN